MVRRLYHGHAPAWFLVQDGPVQRTGAPVADDAWMQDQARDVFPNIVGDDLGQHRAQDQVGVELLNRVAHGLGGSRRRDTHLIFILEQDIGLLCQAIETAGQK